MPHTKQYTWSFFTKKEYQSRTYKEGPLIQEITLQHSVRACVKKIGRRNRMALAFSFIEIFPTFCCARLFGLNGHPSLNPNGPTESGWKKCPYAFKNPPAWILSPLQASGGPWPRFVQAQVHRHVVGFQPGLQPWRPAWVTFFQAKEGSTVLRKLNRRTAWTRCLYVPACLAVY